MSDLSVTKDKATITAIYRDGKKIRGEIFLASQSRNHYGHQKVSDVLESEKNFLPVVIKGEDRIEFVNKNQLLIVEGELSTTEDEEKLSIGLFNVEKVRISFINDNTIEGAMLSEVPPERSRLSDCLNLEQKFITMIKNDRYMYINKRLIVKVESLEIRKPAAVEPPEEAETEEPIQDESLPTDETGEDEIWEE